MHVASGGQATSTGATPAGIVARPASRDELEVAARILVGAFPREFGLLFGRRPGVAEAVTAHVLQGDYPDGRGVWLAWDGAEAVGVVLIEAPPQVRPRLTWRLAWHMAWRHVGPRGWPRLALALLMPRDAVQPGEVYIRVLGVAATRRGRGIGTLLLRCAEDWGRDHLKGRIALHVHGGNPRAHALYRRVGYVDRGYRSSPVMWMALRQRGYYYLTKPLREGPP